MRSARMGTCLGIQFKGPVGYPIFSVNDLIKKPQSFVKVAIWTSANKISESIKRVYIRLDGIIRH